MILKGPGKNPFDGVDIAGVAIRRFDEDFYHCGLLYKVGDEPATLLHLSDNYKLLNEPPSDSYTWADIELHEADKKLLAVLARRISEKQMPYGFDHAGISFDEISGDLNLPVGKGLTCATLIMFLLETKGFTLLRVAEWPANANLTWQWKMLEHLKSISPQHAAEVAKDVGARRFTPTEVVGAATLRKWPVGWEDSRKVAKRIAKEVSKLTAAA
ncbi:hypothetical protein [Phenylobacterium sp.]|uniref:hypothetical protein n=1 Tax=Phenylobacterium sp. TaxID=1871053 RepID=UPI0035B173B9